MKTKRRKMLRCRGDKHDVRSVAALEPWFRSSLAALRAARWCRDGSASGVPCGEPGQNGGGRSARDEREGSGLQTDVGVDLRVALDQGTALLTTLSARTSASTQYPAVGKGRVGRAIAFLCRQMLHQAEWPDLDWLRARCAAFVRPELEPATSDAPESEQGVEPEAGGWGAEKPW